MLVDLNKRKYNVQTNEFNIIPHKEYNNLQIREKVGQFDRIVSLLQELSKVNLGNEIQDQDQDKEVTKQCIFYDVTHGGYIPINCASNFDTIHLINKENQQEQSHNDNITENILAHKISNAF